MRVGENDSNHFLTRSEESGRNGIGQDLLQKCPDVENAFRQFLSFRHRFGRSRSDPGRIDFLGEGDDEPEAGPADEDESLEVKNGGSPTFVVVASGTSVVLKM
jgi:hypothetical protein